MMTVFLRDWGVLGGHALQCGRRNYFFWGGTAERRNYSALAWRNTKTIDIFNFEDGEMRALQRRII